MAYRAKEAARKAKKRAEDPTYRVKEAVKMAKKRQNATHKEEENKRDKERMTKKRRNATYKEEENKRDKKRKTKKRRNATYKEEENKRNKKRMKTANKTKRQRKAANPKGYIDNELIQLISNWKDCEAGSDDLRHRNEKGQHYLGKMTARCGFCGAVGFEAELKSKGTDDLGNKVDNFGDLCCCKGKV